ncbi:hypothetical protein BKA70DRAFT_791705 [Coprinopsis sp. MPI-PUGE-AT-0042]|nr:hypothetical protein BKA70DRAFT_791705 [Coprinopsis sp. MPI-PUGE-AT-0042]
MPPYDYLFFWCFSSSLFSAALLLFGLPLITHSTLFNSFPFHPSFSLHGLTCFHQPPLMYPLVFTRLILQQPPRWWLVEPFASSAHFKDAPIYSVPLWRLSAIMYR